MMIQYFILIYVLSRRKSISVIPLICMLKRRAFDVEVEYHPYSTERESKRKGLFGRQISLPNGFLTSSNLSRSQRTKSTSDLLKESKNTEGK